MPHYRVRASSRTGRGARESVFVTVPPKTSREEVARLAVDASPSEWGWRQRNLRFGFIIAVMPQAPIVVGKSVHGASRERLVQDNDGHWYIIPADREDDFEEAVALAEEECRDLPEWIQPINGHPSRFTFERFRED